MSAKATDEYLALTMADAPTFRSRDYGDREVPDDAVILDPADEDDITIYAWEDDGQVFLQQGYDLIVMTADALLALHNFARAVPAATGHHEAEPHEEATHGA